MRITQGTFSFLADFSDEQIEAQIRYALRNGWAISVEHTDDPHPRNVYWDLWGLPLFDLGEDDAEKAMREVRACREAFADRYIKVLAYDASYGRQTTALSFIVTSYSELATWTSVVRRLADFNLATIAANRQGQENGVVGE